MADEQGAIPEARKLIASILCEEVRAYRHAQDAATTERDKLYRMGQKDALMLIAGQIDDVLAASEVERDRARPAYVADIEPDIELIEKLAAHDYQTRHFRESLAGAARRIRRFAAIRSLPDDGDGL